MLGAVGGAAWGGAEGESFARVYFFTRGTFPVGNDGGGSTELKGKTMVVKPFYFILFLSSFFWITRKGAFRKTFKIEKGEIPKIVSSERIPFGSQRRSEECVGQE